MDTVSVELEKKFLRSNRKRWQLLGVVVAVIIVGTAGTIGVKQHNTKPPIAIPDTIASKILFPIYLPSSLPDGYTQPTNAVSQQEQALIFYIQNESNERLVFSEQALSKEFDINAFHTRSLRDSKSLQDVPYPSIIGKGEQDTWVLSVTADTTWILITSKASNAPTHLENLARHLQPR